MVFRSMSGSRNLKRSLKCLLSCAAECQPKSLCQSPATVKPSNCEDVCTAERARTPTDGVPLGCVEERFGPGMRLTPVLGQGPGNPQLMPVALTRADAAVQSHLHAIGVARCGLTAHVQHSPGSNTICPQPAMRSRSSC